MNAVTPPLLLPVLIALPALAGGLLLTAPTLRVARFTAALAAAITLVLAGATPWLIGPDQPGFQLVFRTPWLPALGADIHLGVDALSALLLPTTALLFAGCLAACWRGASRFELALLLWLEGALLGVFCALDAWLFFLFWEFALLPVYGMTCLRGPTALARSAATKYLLLMLAGSLPLLFGLLLAVDAHGTPDLATMLAAGLPAELQTPLLLLLLAGVAAKMPLVPLHTWLPSLALGSPASLTAAIAGIKVGAYALIRLALPLAPAAAQELHWLLAGLGTLSLLYGAVTVLAHGNLRAMLACFAISHVGLLLLGLASLSAGAFQGAALLLLSFVLCTGGLYLCTDALQRRLGSTDVMLLGGIAQTMPQLAALFLFFGLAALGLPGLAAFPGELLILAAAIKTHTGATLAALFGGVVLTSGFLAAYRQAFLGPAVHTAVLQAKDLVPRERISLAALALAVVALGLLSGYAIDYLAPLAAQWSARFPALR